MDNRMLYGFRPHSCRSGDTPPYIKGLAVSGQSFDVNGGAANVSLRRGDPVYPVASGGFALADGSEGSGGAVSASHIVAAVGWQWDATRGFMEFKHGLASDIAYSTNLRRESRLILIPIESCIWEVDCDDKVTATTEATYRALINDNVDPILCGASGASYASPRLDISSATTTNTLKYRIVGISPTRENRDFAGSYVKMLVEANVVARPAFGGTTGV